MWLYFVFEYSNIRGINTIFLFFYCLAVCVCSLSLILTVFIPIRRISYILFILSFILWLSIRNFVPEISDQLRKIDCIEVGKVWDEDKKNCRTDCITWNKEQGCVKE